MGVIKREVWHGTTVVYGHRQRARRVSLSLYVWYNVDVLLGDGYMDVKS